MLRDAEVMRAVELIPGQRRFRTGLRRSKRLYRRAKAVLDEVPTGEFRDRLLEIADQSLQDAASRGIKK